MAILRVNVSALFVVAGFQVIIGGRFWVITEVSEAGKAARGLTRCSFWSRGSSLTP